MKKLVAISALLLLGISSHAQVNLDSLWQVWEDDTQGDRIRLEAVNQFMQESMLFQNQTDSAYVLSDQMYLLALEGNSKKYEAIALDNLGLCFLIKGEISKAKESFEQSLQIGEDIHDVEGIIESLLNLGQVYEDQQKYIKAINYYDQALELAEMDGDNNALARVFSNIGYLYYSEKNYLKAQEYLARSMDLSVDGDQYFVPEYLIQAGDIQLGQKQVSLAMDYYSRALELSQKLGIRQYITLSLLALGEGYRVQGAYDKALESSFEALKTGENTSAYLIIGRTYQDQENPLKAIEWCEKATSSMEFSTQFKACSCLYDSHKKLNHENEALIYHEKVLLLADSLKTGDIAKGLQQMEFRKQKKTDSLSQVQTSQQIEVIHQEQIKKEESRKNILMYGGIGILILAGGIGGRLRYIKKSRTVLQAEKDRSENLLNAILPYEIKEELKANRMFPGGDFEMVSLLFLDFNRFIPESGETDLEGFNKELIHCVETCDRIIAKYGLQKINTTDNTFIAARGLTHPLPDAPGQTVLAALEICAFMASRKKEREAVDEPAILIQCGVHSHQVAAGILGVKKTQYDIWGDTVSIASLMESSGEATKVNISQDTYELIKNENSFSFEKRAKIEVKGKGDMEMYFVSI